MVVLFTGMSGIDIKKSLKKFKTEFKEFRTKYPEREPELIEFESELENVFYEKHPDIPKSKQVWKDDILTSPYVVLEDLWQSTFNNIYNRIQEIELKQPDKYIFLNIHSCYYHNKTHEYLSLINVAEIKKLNIKIVITLIDDIYEIHHRLTKPGGLFHDEKLPTSTALILRHIMLLDWRSNETMMSRFIAKQFEECKHYVFAIKHSFDTLSNLIYEKQPSAYLSHPITEVRRLERKKEFDKANEIKTEITQIAEFLSSRFISFLPTTIDEYRIDFDKEDVVENGDVVEKKTYYPVLRPRWEEDIFKRPTNLLYTHSGFPDLNELWLKKRCKEKNEAINQLLTALADIISDQVTVRDYSLVEQSEVLVLYRPIFNGNASGGVMEEFNYFLSLKTLGIKVPYCFVYCPQIDIDKFYCKEFTQKIKKEINELKHFKYVDRKKFTELTESEGKKLLEANRNAHLITDVLDEIMERCKIAFSLNSSKTPLSKNEVKAFKEKFVKELIESFEVVDDYRDSENSDIFVDNIMPVNEFFNKISLFLVDKN